MISVGGSLPLLGNSSEDDDSNDNDFTAFGIKRKINATTATPHKRGQQQPDDNTPKPPKLQRAAGNKKSSPKVADTADNTKRDDDPESEIVAKTPRTVITSNKQSKKTKTK